MTDQKIDQKIEAVNNNSYSDINDKDILLKEKGRLYRLTAIKLYSLLECVSYSDKEILEILRRDHESIKNEILQINERLKQLKED